MKGHLFDGGRRRRLVWRWSGHRSERKGTLRRVEKSGRFQERGRKRERERERRVVQKGFDGDERKKGDGDMVRGAEETRRGVLKLEGWGL